MSGKNKKQKLAPGGDAERLTKQCLAIVKALQKNPNAYAFLEPVDWKGLKLLQYPKMVKTPMDLATVEKKLTDGRYDTTDDFRRDIDQIWQNAHIFNQEGSEIHEVATLLSNVFAEKMKEIDAGPLRDEGGSSSGASVGMTTDELNQCKTILRDLKKQKDAGVFLEPVNWKDLNIPDYPTIIKRPMDIGTVLKRLEGGQFTSVHAVYSELDLVWTNAMTYNQDESFIYNIAKDLKVHGTFG